MGTSLTGKNISASYLGLLKTTDNAVIGGTAKIITDGNGNDSPLYLSTTALGIGVTPDSNFKLTTSDQSWIKQGLLVGGTNGVRTSGSSLVIDGGGDSSVNLRFITNSTGYATSDGGQIGFANDGMLFIKSLETTGANYGVNLQTNGGETILFAEATNKNVGINTLSPSSKLTISGGDILLDNSNKLLWGNTSDVYISGTTVSDNIQLGVGGSTQFTFSQASGLRLHQYGGGTITGTATQRLGVDSSGNVIEIPIGAGAVDGAGATGQASFWTDSNTISGDDDFYWNNTSKRLGIGTNNPSANLDVDGIIWAKGNASSTNPGLSNGIYVRYTADTNYNGIVFQGSSGTLYIGRDNTTADDIVFRTRTDELLRIESSTGNVGIGESDPDRILHIKDDSVAAIVLENTSEADSFIDYTNPSKTFRVGYDDSANLFKIASTNFSGQSVNVNSSGDLGVGVSPSAKFEVLGDSYLRTQVFTDTIRPYSGNQLTLLNGGSNTLNIDGDVGINETNPLVPLHISRDSASGENIALILDNNNTTAGNEIGMLFRSAVGSTNTDFEIFGVANGANDMDLVFQSDGSNEVMRITKDGDVNLTASESELLFYSDYTVGNTDRAKIKAIGAGGGSGYGGDLTFHTKNPSNIYSERMRIDSSGNVGIATGATVDDKLHIVGDSAKIQQQGQTGITLKFNHGNNASINSDINIANIKSFVSSGSTGSESGGITFETKPTSGLATERMRITSGGDVGIGVSPASSGDPKLRVASKGQYYWTSGTGLGDFHVGDGTYGLSVGVALGGAGAGDTRLWTTGGLHNMIFATNDVERARITGGGAVGVGITNPDSYGFNGIGLAVKNSNGYGIVSIASDTDKTGYLAFADGTSGDERYRGTVEYEHSTDTMYFRTSGTAKMTIDSSGDLNIVNTGQASLNYTTDGSSDYARITGGKSGSGVGDLRFFTYSGGIEERMRLDSNGHLLVGTESTDPRNFSGGTYGVKINKSQSEFAQTTMYINRAVASDGDAVVFRRNATTVGSISVTSSATAYNTSSDYRLKENVVELTGALDRISQLKPSRFNFIADAETTVDGFLAHEVQDIVPEAITGEKDATEEYEVTPEVLDDEGNVVEEAVMGTRDVYQGIDQSKLVPLLVASIQELKAEIDELKKKL